MHQQLAIVHLYIDNIYTAPNIFTLFSCNWSIAEFSKCSYCTLETLTLNYIVTIYHLRCYIDLIQQQQHRLHLNTVYSSTEYRKSIILASSSWKLGRRSQFSVQIMFFHPEEGSHVIRKPIWPPVNLHFNHFPYKELILKFRFFGGQTVAIHWINLGFSI